MPRSPWPPPARPLTVAPSIGETFMAPACHPEWQRRIRRRAAAARPFPGRQEPGRTRMLFRSCGILPLRSSGLRLTGAQDDRARRQVHAYGGSLLPCSLPIDPPSRSLTIVPPARSLTIGPPSPSPWLPPAPITVAPSFPHHRRGAASDSEQARYRSAKNSGDGWGGRGGGLARCRSQRPYSLLPFLLTLQSPSIPSHSHYRT